MEKEREEKEKKKKKKKTCVFAIVVILQAGLSKGSLEYLVDLVEKYLPWVGTMDAEI